MPINFNPRYQQQALESLSYVSIENDSTIPPLTSTGSNPPAVYNKTARLVYDVGNQEINAAPFGDNSASDAFGRLRVSSPVTLLDSKALYNKTPFVFDEALSGSGSSVFIPNDSLVHLSTNSVNSFAIRQTFIKFNYQPGKSMQGIFTGVFTPETNIVKRVGLFQGLTSVPYTPTDGMYLEVNSTGPRFVVLKAQGTTYSVVAPQSSWNLDKLDGTGPSGISLDFNNAQIFALDYEWLGVGRVRFGFFVDGKLLYAHQVTNRNVLTAPYISSPNQPVRYEIRQTGAGTGSMKQICSTVLLEGNEELVGTLATASLTATVDGATSGNFTPLISVRLNPLYTNVVALVRGINVLNVSSNGIGKYKVIKNPTFFSSTPIWNDIPNSTLQWAHGTTGTAVSGGFDLMSNGIGSGTGSTQTTGEIDLIGLNGRLGAKIDGTSDIITIAGSSLTNTATYWAFINLIQKS